MKIFIPEDYQGAVQKLQCVQLLAKYDLHIYNDHIEPSALAQKMAQAEVLVLIRERLKVNETLLSMLPNLKLISQTGRISSHIDIAACNRFKVAVAEGKGSPVAPAELTWALILNGMRLLPQAIDDMKRGRWQTTIGDCLSGKHIGIWGYGKIGRIIAGYAKAFGMHVLIWGSDSSKANAALDGYAVAENKEHFFETADVLTLHLRLSASTAGVVTATDLSRMKTTSLLVNTSRAELIEPGALITALKSGRPGRAAVDVYENEPFFTSDHPLLRMKNVICTPHLGYVERQAYELYFRIAFENIVQFASGHPVNIVNPEALQLK